MSDSRLRPLPERQRCGLPSCWCTPPAVTATDYGTRVARKRLVPRDVHDPVPQMLVPPMRVAEG